MSVKRAAKLMRRAKRKEKKRAADLDRRVKDAIKVLSVVAEVGGAYIDEEAGTTHKLTDAAYRDLTLPEKERRRAVRDQILAARSRHGGRL